MRRGHLRVRKKLTRSITIIEPPIEREVIRSILNPIAKVNIRTQGAGGNYISESTSFAMTELDEIREADGVSIRTPGKARRDLVLYDQFCKVELSPEF